MTPESEQHQGNTIRTSPLLSVEETAAYLGMSKRWVYQTLKKLCPARKIGGALKFLRDDLDLFIEKLQQVTADQVREVARKYLVDDRLTVAYLDPQPLNGAPARAAPPAGVRHGN